MKTPEEIKKGLYHCGTIDVSCTNCPYDEDCHTQGDGYCSVEDDALIYIERLETRLAQAERERDAAVKEMRMAFGMASVCRSCKYNDVDEIVCMDCKCGDLWKWRGVVEENSR